MNKREFDKFVHRNYDTVKVIHCRVWNGFEDGEDVAWLDVYFEDEDFTSIFCSDYYDIGSKELYKLQK